MLPCVWGHLTDVCQMSHWMVPAGGVADASSSQAGCLDPCLPSERQSRPDALRVFRECLRGSQERPQLSSPLTCKCHADLCEGLCLGERSMDTWVSEKLWPRDITVMVRWRHILKRNLTCYVGIFSNLKAYALVSYSTDTVPTSTLPGTGLDNSDQNSSFLCYIYHCVSKIKAIRTFHIYGNWNVCIYWNNFPLCKFNKIIV